MPHMDSNVPKSNPMVDVDGDEGVWGMLRGQAASLQANQHVVTRNHDRPRTLALRLNGYMN